MMILMVIKKFMKNIAVRLIILDDLIDGVDCFNRLSLNDENQFIANNTSHHIQVK